MDARWDPSSPAPINPAYVTALVWNKQVCMKKIYHLCLSSHREVLFRNEEDFTIGFNYLAEAAFYTESRLLADGFMSTHWHNIVRTEVPDELTARFRYAQLPADPGRSRPIPAARQLRPTSGRSRQPRQPRPASGMLLTGRGFRRSTSETGLAAAALHQARAQKKDDHRGHPFLI